MRLARDNKRDANEGEIVSDLERIGCSVLRLNEFDLLVGYRGRDFKLEVKMPKGKKTDSQIDMQKDWKGSPLYFVRSSDEAIKIVTAPSKK